MSQPEVTVVGSFAVGLTLRADRLPVAGETLIGRDFDQGPGGKGSNQAVQLARLGARATFVGLVGRDAYAAVAHRLYADEGVDTRYLATTTERNTGLGFIVLDADGENFIVLDPGANELLTERHVSAAAQQIARSDALVTQLEIPTDTAAAALREAKRAGVPSILNPAPARPLDPAILAAADVITPNETELRILLGLPANDSTPSEDLCARLLDAGVGTVVLTQGPRGALVVTAGDTLAVPAFAVEVVDTTGAGDAFTGTLAYCLASGMELGAATRHAAAAGALACRRLGVVPALPTWNEVQAVAA